MYERPEKYLHSSLVVWNPWSDGAKKMSDFGDEEYRNMICVEPGYVAERVKVKPGEGRSFGQTIRVLSPAKPE